MIRGEIKQLHFSHKETRNLGPRHTKSCGYPVDILDLLFSRFRR